MRFFCHDHTTKFEMNDLLQPWLVERDSNLMLLQYRSNALTTTSCSQWNKKTMEYSFQTALYEMKGDYNSDISLFLVSALWKKTFRLFFEGLRNSCKMTNCSDEFSNVDNIIWIQKSWWNIFGMETFYPKGPTVIFWHSASFYGKFFISQKGSHFGFFWYFWWEKKHKKFEFWCFWW